MAKRFLGLGGFWPGQGLLGRAEGCWSKAGGFRIDWRKKEAVVELGREVKELGWREEERWEREKKKEREKREKKRENEIF